MDLEFSRDKQKLIREYINEALDNGEYHDGFEVAIYRRDLEFDEFEELIRDFRLAYKESIVDSKYISEIVRKYLPQCEYLPPDWLVSDLGEIYITDGLRVAKIYNDSLQWVTKRVSYDGIILNKIETETLVGRWFNPCNDDRPWNPLKLSLEDGSVIVGEIIEH